MAAEVVTTVPLAPLITGNLLKNLNIYILNNCYFTKKIIKRLKKIVYWFGIFRIILQRRCTSTCPCGIGLNISWRSFEFWVAFLLVGGFILLALLCQVFQYELSLATFANGFGGFFFSSAVFVVYFRISFSAYLISIHGWFWDVIFGCLVPLFGLSLPVIV